MPFGLVLGPDSPREENPGPGNLGLTANMFLTYFIVTHVSICSWSRSTMSRRSRFTAVSNAPLPLILMYESAASVPGLSPGKSSAQIRWTSELLRFL